MKEILTNINKFLIILYRFLFYTKTECNIRIFEANGYYSYTITEGGAKEFKKETDLEKIVSNNYSEFSEKYKTYLKIFIYEKHLLSKYNELYSLVE